MFVLVAVSLLIAAAVVIALGVESRRGLPRSAWWGVRTKLTMSSPAVFAEANRAVWQWYIVNGVILILEAAAVVVFGVIRRSDEILAFVVLGGSLLILVVAAMQVYLANRSVS